MKGTGKEETEEGDLKVLGLERNREKWVDGISWTLRVPRCWVMVFRQASEDGHGKYTLIGSVSPQLQTLRNWIREAKCRPELSIGQWMGNGSEYLYSESENQKTSCSGSTSVCASIPNSVPLSSSSSFF